MQPHLVGAWAGRLLERLSQLQRIDQAEDALTLSIARNISPELTKTSGASSPLRHCSTLGWITSVILDRNNAPHVLLLVAATCGRGCMETSKINLSGSDQKHELRVSPGAAWRSSMRRRRRICSSIRLTSFAMPSLVKMMQVWKV